MARAPGRLGLVPKVMTASVCLALAACDSGANGEPAEAGNQSSTLGDATEEVPATVTPTPAVARSARPPADAPIPSALHGRWALTPKDCTSTRGDAKGLLRVSANELRFYESRAALGTVVERSPSRIVANFDFMGEGQTWQRRMTLEEKDDGRTLIRQETGEDAIPTPLRYRKCEAA